MKRRFINSKICIILSLAASLLITGVIVFAAIMYSLPMKTEDVGFLIFSIVSVIVSGLLSLYAFRCKDGLISWYKDRKNLKTVAVSLYSSYDYSAAAQNPPAEHRCLICGMPLESESNDCPSCGNKKL